MLLQGHKRYSSVSSAVPVTAVILLQSLERETVARISTSALAQTGERADCSSTQTLQPGPALLIVSSGLLTTHRSRLTPLTHRRGPAIGNLLSHRGQSEARRSKLGSDARSPQRRAEVY